MKIKQLYFTNRFFYSLIGIAAMFVISFFFNKLFIPVQIILWSFFILCAVDIVFLFILKKPIKAQRIYPDKLSNGDENEFQISISSKYPFKTKIRILEEIPIQLQKRDFELRSTLDKNKKEETFKYLLRPVKRGVYNFGRLNIFASFLGMVERKIITAETIDIPCYPSFIQLRKYLLMATTNRLTELGVKRIRRIGSTLEFERVRDYSKGDEYRFINWKATAKVNKLMVNQFEDKRSQPIYSFIDLSRSMRMPFNGLTLLDYAINSSLVLSNVSILKHDKAGILTFSKNIETHVVADKRNHQMHLISEALYKITTDFQESEFGRLYAYTKRNINQRSLIFVYTNFETLDAVHRQMQYLRLLNKSHIVVAIVFKNTELQKMAKEKAEKSIEIYNKIIAEKFNYEKHLIIRELHANGIQTIFTEPKNLTVDSINKYLEIKAKGMI